MGHSQGSEAFECYLLVGFLSLQDSGQVTLGFALGPTPESGEVITEVFLGHLSSPEPHYKLMFWKPDMNLGTRN